MIGSSPESETSEMGNNPAQSKAAAAARANGEIDESVGLRLDKYRRCVNKLKLYAVGLGTGITFFGAVKFAEGVGQPFLARLLSGIFLTDVLAAAFLIVRSYGRIQYQVDALTRYIDNTNGGTHSAPAPLNLQMTMGEAKKALEPMQTPVYDRWPPDEKIQTAIALYLEIAGFLILLCYVWIPVFHVATKIAPTSPSTSLLVSVHFDPNRAVIPADLVPVIQQAIRGIKDNKSLCLRLEGYADLDGTAQYNLDLSSLRTKAAQAILASEGVESKRIEIVAYGETRPQSAGTSASAKAQNRRVDIFLQPCGIPAK